MVARVAREAFQIDRVVARIYDARRAAIYERLGIPTVATVQWTIERVLRRILPDTSQGVEWIDPSAKVCLVERVVPGALGRPAARSTSRSTASAASSASDPARARPACPTAALIAQEGDVVCVTVAGDRIDELDEHLGRRPGQGSALMRVVIVGGGNVGTYIAGGARAGRPRRAHRRGRPRPGRVGR